MKGINIKEFCESLEHNHELEFEYNGNEYVIQPIVEDNRRWLVAYLYDSENKDNTENPVKEAIHLEIGVEKEVVDRVLNAKCFDGNTC